MTRLTEDMVIARSKVSDLSLIKKLNCWGLELSDISILKRMRGLEVVSLSVNKITSLQPFKECQKLQDLFIRKNAIQNINEIAHLKNLPYLKHLWLEENPCCENLGTNYRATVLRALPNLKKLDNVDVTEEEVNDALRSAGDNSSGAQEEDAYEDAHEQQQQQQHQIPPNVQNPQQKASQRGSHHSQHTQHSSGCGPSASPTKEEQIHPKSPKYNQNTSEQRMSLPQADVRAPFLREHYQSERPHHSPHYRQNQTNFSEWDEHSHAPHHNPYGSSASLHHILEHPPYHNGYARENVEWEEPLSSRPRHSDIQPQSVGSPVFSQYAPVHRRPVSRSSTMNELDEHPHAPHHNPYGSSASLHHILEHSPYHNGYARENVEWEEPLSSRPRRSDIQPSVNSAAFSQYAPVHRRPVSRSSNLLSAALCLVKELDYNSLEVFEHSVHSRIMELSNE